MEGDTALPRRMAVTLVAVLLLDVAFAAVLAALLAPWLAPVGDALATVAGRDSLPAALRWLAVLSVGLAVLVAVQLRYTRRRLRSAVSATPASPASRPDLCARVERLAALADVPAPAVAVVDTDVPNSFTVVGVGDPTVYVSEGLLAELGGDQLDAVLAHELAHITNRDARVLTLASFLPALADGREGALTTDDPVAWLVVLCAASLLAAAAVDAPLASGTYLATVVALVLTTMLLGGIVLGVLAVPMAALARRLARDREYAADRAGAILTGDPAALATALERLDADTPEPPASDARTSRVDAFCLLPHGFGTDGAERAEAALVETRAHPPTEKRIERLGDLAADLEA